MYVVDTKISQPYNAILRYQSKYINNQGIREKIC